MSRLTADGHAVKVLLAALMIASLTTLPRLTAKGSVQISSQDRPEHPWLTSLTANPDNTMTCHLIGSLCVLALWSSKISHRSTMTDLTNALLGTACTTVVVFGCILVMGAPLNSLLLRSLVLSLQSSALMVFPFFYTYGIPRLDDKGIAQRYRLTRLLCSVAPEDPLERAVTLPGLGAVVGTWIGVIPLALDWDRPWQSFPLAPVACATVGFVLGMFA